MSWRSYSWKAITCCISKGLLVCLVLASALVGMATCGMWVERRAEARELAKEQRCQELLSAVPEITAEAPPAEFNAGTMTIWFERTLNTESPEYAAYAAECVERSTKRPMPAWLPAVFWSFIAFGAMLLVVVPLCQSNISYCQAAVETKRKPWYWVPWIGDPLPARNPIRTQCGTCGHVEERPETEDEYRARLGLPPVGTG